MAATTLETIRVADLFENLRRDTVVQFYIRSPFILGRYSLPHLENDRTTDRGTIIPTTR